MDKAKAWVAAIMAGLSAGLATLVPLVDDGLQASEALGAIVAALAAFTATGVVTYKVPNAPTPPPEGG